MKINKMWLIFGMVLLVGLVTSASYGSIVADCGRDILVISDINDFGELSETNKILSPRLKRKCIGKTIYDYKGVSTGLYQND